MWKKLAPLLIVLSVAVNTAFIGMWAVRAVGSRCRRNVSCRDTNESGGIGCPLHRDLGVDREQWKQIEPRLAKFREAAHVICRGVDRARAEMIDLIAAPEPDREAILAKQEEILAGQRKMQELIIEHLLTEKDILTPEQRKAFFRIFRRRSGCAGHGPAMGMSFDEDSSVQKQCRSNHGERR